MKRYEYIALLFDLGDLQQLNRFAGDGWRVVSMLPNSGAEPALMGCWALLEREIPESIAKLARNL